MIKSVSRNGAILGAFALTTVAFIGLTHMGTKDQIAQQQFERLRSTLDEVLPSSLYDNNLIQDCTLIENSPLSFVQPQRVYRARSADNTVGFVIETTTPNGYSGNIHMLVGVLIDGTISGARVLEHKETPGLGDKIDLRISDWILDFTNERYSDETAHLWEVKKNGGKFDQFTGATITPRAVVNQIAATAEYVLNDTSRLVDAANNCGAIDD